MPHQRHRCTATKGIIGLLAALSLALSACASVDAPPAPAVMEQHIAITSPAGQADALLFVPAGAARHPAIIVWPDLTGLRPAYADLGRKVSEAGYVVLVPNAFYRTVKLDGSTATAQPRVGFGETLQRGAPWRAAADDAAVMADARALVAYLDALPQVDTAAPIGALGVDIGGAHAFIAARGAPDRIGSVAVVHPLSIATTRDTSPHLFVAQSRAAYFIELAASDDAREPDDKDDLRRAFASAGLSGTVSVAPADHGYLVADDPAYRAAIASRTWTKILAHFAATVR